jgi:hypothetical protein
MEEEAMIAVLLLCFAPAPFLEGSVYPGKVFRSWNYVMRVYKVDAKGIYFESARTGYRDWLHGDFMPHAEYRKLLKECPQDDLEDRCVQPDPCVEDWLRSVAGEGW